MVLEKNWLSRMVFFCLMLTLSFHAVAQKSQASQKTGVSVDSKSTFSFRTIPAQEGSFGYDVYKDEKMIIHQPTIPGRSGNSGFRDEASAARAAKLVLKKLDEGQMPPTVTLEELRKANAID